MASEGISAQSGELVFKDREIMKKTILRGDNPVFARDVCDVMKKKVPVEGGAALEELCRETHSVEGGHAGRARRAPRGRIF